MRIRTTALAWVATGALLASTIVGCSGEEPNFSGKGGSGAAGGVGGGGGSGGLGGGDVAVCGDEVIEGTEECDDGNDVQDDGCDNACRFNCIAGDDKRDKCDDANACNGKETCGADHACASGTALGEGDSCGTDLVCVNGGCVSASCGDGIVQTGEECDDANSTSGDGCENDCKLSCVSTDATRDCSTMGGDECGGAQACDDTAHICKGTPLADGTSCNAGAGTCKAGVCTALDCGNGVVDAGEDCEPPGTATCSATCQAIAVAVCGDGKLDSGEECDDANKKNLDGCDSSCKYENFMRMDSITINNVTAPSFCTVTTNQLGKAITNTAKNSLNDSLKAGVDAGTTNVLIQALGLDDPRGVADDSLKIGVTSGYLDPAHAGTWPATGNPMDWWFLLDKSTVDANGLPTGLLTPAAIAARALTAGPADVNVSLLLAGSPAVLQMRDAKASAQFDAATSKPPLPTQLAGGFVSAEALDANGAGRGLCGNITVESLARIPIPQSLTTGTTACSSSCSNSKKYTYCGEGNPVGPSCNSLLDSLVGGCKVSFLCISALNPTQPDVSGSGTKTLSVGGTYNKVQQATDGNTNAYSSWLSFHAKRAHATGTK